MEFNTPGAGLLAHHAGADFVFWDLQHTGWTFTEIAMGVGSLRGRDTVAGVRVPAANPADIGRALDLGAEMIMVPAVRDATQARDVVQASRYPVEPIPGTRAVTFSVAWDAYSKPDDVQKALSDANRRIRIFAQIETLEGLENVHNIAQVDGIDVLWVGDGDLAASLGVPGDFEASAYKNALRSVASAARDAGKLAGFTTADPRTARDLYKIGFRIFAFGNDIKIFSEAMSNGVAVIKNKIN
ncbi:HpcH/HpaI aldolase family protein [Nesterenkonia ebinurensis]|uniref:HpcH/HpaI aldolase family protein n=1 Tax=Nesterenkonia ebinurensis TaxID=2608252 RepID=UPI00168B2052|nr:aldolase/citrate lyase family protein [Nesterenkonia ebinurensis]